MTLKQLSSSSSKLHNKNDFTYEFLGSVLKLAHILDIVHNHVLVAETG